MVSLLSTSWNGELDPAWMPSSNIGNLSQTLRSLPWQLPGVPPADDTLGPVALVHANDGENLVLGKDCSN